MTRGEPAVDALQAALESRADRRIGEWRPSLFEVGHGGDRQRLAELLDRERDVSVSSTIGQQVCELVECRDPRVKDDAAERDRRVGAHLQGRPLGEYGCWAYYPWQRRLVQILPEREFREVRSSRNRYKITAEEQQRLRSFTIGVVGLSVGQAVAVAMALEGCAGGYRLADFDGLALSNMNRLVCGVADLGVNKAVLAARRMFEIDPYLEIRVFLAGLTEQTVEAFLEEGGRLDLLVEECDDLFMKVHLRERARALRIPVLMETNDRGMLDIERFDLEPQRELFHGLIGPVGARALKGLTIKEKVPFVLKILGEMSPRLAASLVEIDQTIVSWPQLGSGAMLGGAVTADAARRLLLGEITASGRFHVDIHGIIRDPVEAGTAQPPAGPPPERPEPGSAPVGPTTPRGARGARLSDQQVREIVSFGVLAPSGGNCQPWKFAWSAGGQLRCIHDVARSESFLDFDHWAAYLAVGAAVENIVIAAAAVGLDATVVPFPDGGPDVVCDIAFSPISAARSASGPALAPFIARRATNRRNGLRVPLAPEETAGLHAALGEPAAELQILTGADHLDEIGLILGAGDRFRFLCETLHREMMGEMRWSSEQARQTGDGIDIATLDLREVDEAGLRLLSSWPVVRFLRSLGMGGALEDLSKRAVDSASAVALITYAGTSPAACFMGGRAMERVWLTATALGLAVQPMSSLPYLFARLERGAGFDPRERDTLHELRERYSRVFRVGSDTAELLLFRIGKADPPTARSLRRPLEAVLSFS
jgi:nitroreductase